MSDPFEHILQHVQSAIDSLVDDGRLPAGDLPRDRINVEPPRDASHGDMATNAAMLLAKPARMKPRDIAGMIAEELADNPDIASTEIAGPGFINLTLVEPFWHRQLAQILHDPQTYGRVNVGGGAKMNVEYCSANPTGPLHVGHARGTIFGDVLANLLDFVGYDVTREYYVNDAGGQVDVLARSLHHRYREALGHDTGPLAEGLYPGDYLVPVGQELADRFGDQYAEGSEDDWLELFKAEAMSSMIGIIKADLASAGIHHDVFTSEKSLLDAGKTDEVLAELTERGLIYTGTLPPPKGHKDDDWEPLPQLLFKATDYGDDQDRPLKRANGAWTYFANDCAYHYDKYRRGFHQMIDMFGADHGGYVKRMKAATRAVTNDQASLDILICQLVNFLDNGKPLKMSKRAGRLVTLRDVVDAVGVDVLRFIMLTRKNDATLDFDLQAVTEQSRENPVFYVQYAHARICSVFRNASDAQKAQTNAEFSLLSADAERALIRQIASFPRMIRGAAKAHEPHRIAYFLQDTAAAFHTLWTKGKEDPALRFLLEDDLPRTQARLALLLGTKIVLANGLQLLGVSPMEELS